jgi:hypothetical protein
MPLTLETTLHRDPTILHAPVGTEETVMLSVEAGKYYGLNAVGSYVWERLQTPATLAELRAAVCAAFDVDARTCEADLLAFAGDLLAAGIVHAIPD